MALTEYCVFTCLNCTRILKSVKALEDHQRRIHGVIEITHKDYDLIWLKPPPPPVSDENVAGTGYKFGDIGAQVVGESEGSVGDDVGGQGEGYTNSAGSGDGKIHPGFLVASPQPPDTKTFNSKTKFRPPLLSIIIPKDDNSNSSTCNASGSDISEHSERPLSVKSLGDRTNVDMSPIVPSFTGVELSAGTSTANMDTRCLCKGTCMRNCACRTSGRLCSTSCSCRPSKCKLRAAEARKTHGQVKEVSAVEDVSKKCHVENRNEEEIINNSSTLLTCTLSIIPNTLVVNTSSPSLETAIKPTQKIKKVKKKRPQKEAKKPPNFDYFKGYTTGGVSVEGLSMWASSTTKAATKLAKSLPVSFPPETSPRSQPTISIGSTEAVSMASNLPTMTVTTSSQVPVMVTGQAILNRTHVTSSEAGPTMVRSESGQNQRVSRDGSVMNLSHLVAKEDNLKPREQEVPAQERIDLEDLSVAQREQYQAQPLALESHQSMVRDMFIQVTADRQEVTVQPMELGSSPAGIPQRVGKQAKIKKQKARACDDSSCRPCSITTNCQKCYYCLNRAKLKQKCKDRQCSRLNSKLSKRPQVFHEQESQEEQLRTFSQGLTETPLVMLDSTEVEEMTLATSQLEENGQDIQVTEDSYQELAGADIIVEKIISDIISDISTHKPEPVHNAKPYFPLDKIYPCPKCKKMFAQFKSLVKHKKLCYNKTVKMFICDVCKKALSNKRSLTRHRKAYHSGKSKPDFVLDCVQCAISFTTKNKLKVHMFNKHGQTTNSSDGDNNIIKCSVAGCSFQHVKNSFIKAHITRVHASKDKINCKICAFQCYSSSGMNKHLRAVHTVTSEELTVGEEETDTLFVEAGVSFETLGGGAQGQFINVLENYDLMEDLLNSNAELNDESIDATVMGENLVDDISFESGGFGFMDETNQLGLVGSSAPIERVLQFKEM